MKYKYILAGIIGGLMTIAGSVYSLNVTVPSATTGQGSLPIGLTSGNYTNGYIVGGSNVTISTSTLGQITISSTGGGGSGGGTWSTTTSSVPNHLINYPNNNTDVVTIGSNATTSAKFYFDPNISYSYLVNASTTAFSATTICLTGDTCLTKWPSGTFPFTSQYWGNSTSTVIGFLNGFFSTASSTISGNFFTPNLSQGLLFVGTNGIHQTVSTSTLSATSPLTGSFTQVGSGGTLGCQTASGAQAGCLASADWTTFNNKQPAGTYLTSYDPFTHPYTTSSATTSTLYFQGFTANASSTISSSLYLSSLSQGFAYTGSNGLVQTVASSSINLSGFNNDLANLTALNTTLTFSGSYNGSTARTVALNLGNANTWTVNQTFNYSSSTAYSSFVTASTTNLILNNQSFNNLLGSGLLNNSNALTCATSNSTTFGCLTANDYNRFNSATTTAGAGLVYSNSANTFAVNTTQNINTLSNLTSNGLLYTANGSGILNVAASSSIFGFTPLSGYDAWTHFAQGYSATTSSMDIGTSTGSLATLTLASTTSPQLSLSNGTGLSQWTIANEGQNLYFSTTTVAGTATSSIPAVTFSSTGSVRISTSTDYSNSIFSAVGTTTVVGQINSVLASSSAVASSYTVNWSLGNTQLFIVNQSTSFVLNATSSNPIDGGKYALEICQDGTGSRTVTWVTPGNLVWWNGTTTIASGANQGTWLGMIYKAKTGRYDIIASSTITNTLTCLP